MFKNPTPPDGPFSERYRKTFKYAFCMLYDGETAADFELQAHGASQLPPQFVVLNINPQSVNLSEPFATSIRLAENGGKIIESRGSVMKHGTVAGTTGYLPGHMQNGVIGDAAKRKQLVANDPQLDQKLGAISGFKAFHDLRYLFRKYGAERRNGRTDVKFFFFNFKDDDFYRIEPKSFTLNRSSRKPYSYDYNIVFDCIDNADNVIDSSIQLEEPVELPIRWRRPASSSSGLFQTISRMKTMVTAGNSFVKHVSGTVQRKFQAALRAVNNVVGFFEDFHDTLTIALDTVGVLLNQLSSSLDGLATTIDLYLADDNSFKLRRELHQWWLEVEDLSLALWDRFISTTVNRGRVVYGMNSQFASGRMKEGAATDLMRMPAGGTSTLDKNPLMSRSGLNLVTDVRKLAAAKSVRNEFILRGENIYTLARRVLGDPNRYVDLVVLNNLSYPYIVSDSAKRPSGTLAWNDTILVPSDENALTGDGGPSTAPTVSGTVSVSGASNEITDNNLDSPWLEDQFIGYTCTATTGGVSEERVVVTNTVDTLTVNIPYTISITTETTYALTLKLFEVSKPPTPETFSFGADLLLKFDANGRADIVWNSRNDLALVTGLDNLIQALNVRMRMELGRHPFHKTFGIQAPIGRPVSDDVGVFYSYFMRRSLLQDPRVAQVRNATLSYVNDKLQVSAEVTPKQTRKATKIQVTLE